MALVWIVIVFVLVLFIITAMAVICYLTECCGALKKPSPPSMDEEANVNVAKSEAEVPEALPTPLPAKSAKPSGGKKASEEMPSPQMTRQGQPGSSPSGPKKTSAKTKVPSGPSGLNGPNGTSGPSGSTGPSGPSGPKTPSPEVQSVASTRTSLTTGFANWFRKKGSKKAVPKTVKTSKAAPDHQETPAAKEKAVPADNSATLRRAATKSLKVAQDPIGAAGPAGAQGPDDNWDARSTVSRAPSIEFDPESGLPSDTPQPGVKRSSTKTDRLRRHLLGERSNPSLVGPGWRVVSRESIKAVPVDSRESIKAVGSRESLSGGLVRKHSSKSHLAP